MATASNEMLFSSHGRVAESEQISPNQQLLKAIEAVNLKEIEFILSKYPETALQSIETKYNLLHLVFKTILQGVLNSPDQPLSEEATNDSENFDPLTRNLGALVTIGIILIRHGINPSKINSETISPLNLLNDGKGFTYGFGKGFFPTATKNFLDMLGVMALYDTSYPKTIVDLHTLFSLEGALYKQMQSLPGFLTQLKDETKHQQDPTILNKQILTLKSLLDEYTKNKFIPRDINDLCSALETIKIAEESARQRSEALILKAELTITVRELEEIAKQIQKALTLKLTTEQKSKLTEYREIASKLTEITTVKPWIHTVKNFIHETNNYLRYIPTREIDPNDFLLFLQNLKEQNKTRLIEQSKENPSLLPLAIIAAAKSMQLNDCLFLIRLGASPTIEITTLEGSFSASTHLALALKDKSTPHPTIEAILLLLAREEQLFVAMDQLKRLQEHLNFFITQLPFITTHSKSLLEYHNRIKPILTQYQEDLFDTKRTSSQTEELTNQVLAEVSTISEVLFPCKQEIQNLRDVLDPGKIFEPLKEELLKIKF